MINGKPEYFTGNHVMVHEQLKWKTAWDPGIT